MKISLFKISFALLIISIYMYIFGVMDIVEVGGEVAPECTSDDYSDISDVSDIPVYSDTSDNSELSATSSNSVRTATLPEGASVRVMPGFGDYNAPAAFSGVVTDSPYTDIEPDSRLEMTPAFPTASSDSTVSTTSTTASKTTTSATSATSSTTTTTSKANTSADSPTSQITAATAQQTASQSADSTPTVPTGERLKVMSGGVLVEGDAFDIITRVVQNEIGSSFHKNAIQAQAIAAYSYIKRENIAGTVPPPTVLLAASASDRVKECVSEVWGKAIYYNNEMISAVYSASSAGWSASAKSVWGQDIPYLQSVKCAFDLQHDPNAGKIATFSSDEVKANVLKHTGIQLTGNPADWFMVNTRVNTVYAGEMSIGGRTTFTSGGVETAITGRFFREKVMGFGLRSAAFTFKYDEGSDSFIFTTDGYGHGVGMSQNGANILATHHGYSYVDILKHYYTGVEVK